MATGLYPLRLLQLGGEAVAGTAVPATKKVIGRAGVKPMISWDREDFPRGIRVPNDEITAVERGSEFTIEADLSFEQLQWPLHSGLQTVAAVGVGPYVYTHEIVVAPTLKTFTAEFVVDDGSTKHYEREFAYCLTREFQISIERNQMAKLRWSMFGRAEQTSTVTAGLSSLTLERVPSNLFKVWIDGTYANLGTTQKTATLRGAVLTVPTGVGPESTLDGRTDYDFVQPMYEQAKPTLTTRFLHNANTATEVGNWRTGTRRFIRLKADNGAAAGANRVIQLDMSVRLLSWEFGDENGQEIVNATWEIVYDATSSKSLVVVLTNGLSAIQ